MNSDASFQCGCKENVSDTCSQSLKEQNIKYTPKQKRPKLGHSVPDVEHRSMVVSTICKNHYQVLPYDHFQEYCWDMQVTRFSQHQEYVMGDISQVCTKENYCKKSSPKCSSRRVSLCSTASGELYLPTDTSSLVEENNTVSNENTTVQVVCTYITVCLSCDTSDACKMSVSCGYTISNYSCTAVLTVL